MHNGSAPLDLIPIKNTILHDVQFNAIKDKIMNRLQELRLTDVKYVADAEFVLYVMNLIEHLVAKKDKIDKKELFVSIAREHLGASDEQIDLLKSLIEFLHVNKSIKKVSYYKAFKAGFSEWFRKK